jgi:hypothetical protein
MILSTLRQLSINDMAGAIQLSLAPVFLLNGIAVLLSMLTSRLARIVDRARTLEQQLESAGGTHAPEVLRVLGTIRRRARLMNIAITLSTFSALLVALVVALMFGSALVGVSLAELVGLAFIISMLSLVGALVTFLIEVRVATAALRIGPSKY